MSGQLQVAARSTKPNKSLSATSATKRKRDRCGAGAGDRRSWPCDPDRGPIVERSGIETPYPVAGTYTAQLLVYEPPWPVDGGFAAIEVDIDVR